MMAHPWLVLLQAILGQVGVGLEAHEVVTLARSLQSPSNTELQILELLTALNLPSSV